MTNNNQDVLIPLTEKHKRNVLIGGVLLMLSIAMFGVGFSVIQAPILNQMNASDYYSLITIFASLGLTITTPIGGKLGDQFGRRNVIIISGLICIVSAIGMVLSKSIVPFAVFRLLVSASQGAFTAAPYILAREVNRENEAPKYMGILASSIAIGGFAGSILLGLLADLGYLRIAMIVPVIPLAVAIMLIGTCLPNIKQEGKVKIDYLGIIVLTVLFSSFSLTLNFSSKLGWNSPKIIAGIVIFIISLFVFRKVENKADDPLVPMYLFKNTKYTVTLVIGFICYFYQVAMNSYIPLTLQDLMNYPSTVAGSIQLPRTIIVMILPSIFGVWVSKGVKNRNIAMVFATGLAALAFIPLVRISSSTSLMMIYILIAITGISEAFRAVSVTPAAQATLDQKDLGVGTALVTFVNSTSSLVASAVFGSLYTLGSSLENSLRMIYICVVIVSLIGLVLTAGKLKKDK